MALMKLKKYSEANAAFSIAHALAPDNPSILNNLAVSYQKSGKPSRARTSFRRALELDPDNKRIQANMKDLTGKE
jgi:Flp pilus assembly protein TadD